MNKQEEMIMTTNTKIANVKKSCRTGRIVANILMILCIVGCTVSIATGGIILGMGKKFDDAIAESGYELNESDKIMSARVFNMDLGDFDNIESDVPAIQEAINDHPKSIAFGTYMFLIGAAVGICAAVLGVLRGTFKLIENSDTPFTVKIRNRITLCLIVTAVCIAGTVNIGFAAVVGIAAWAVYNILDYGIALQTESDETL